MMMPDCRCDDYYNADFLDKNDYSCVRGFDWATEIVDSLFNNDDYLVNGDEEVRTFLDKELPEELTDEYTMDYAFPEARQEERKTATYGDYIRMMILSWLESHRNELIVSMIDNMDDDIFTAIRNKVLSENALSDDPKEYYDSKKYMYSGKKEMSDVSNGEDT